MQTLKARILSTTLFSVVAFALARNAGADNNLVQNGGFESTTAGAGQLDPSYTEATGWTTSGYNFLFTSGSADTTGAPGTLGTVGLWGPNDGGGPNGLTASSPAGGNYVALDSDFVVGPLQQTITGLTVGHTYSLSFYWAAAQQTHFTGPTADNLAVSLGSQTQTTVTFDLASQAFSGWMTQSFSYTATDTSEVLSFLAGGVPAGEPPFALLDGVSLVDTSVPDTTSTAVLLGFAAVILGFAPRFRQQ